MKLGIADFLTLSRLFLTPVLIISVLNNWYILSGLIVLLVIISDWLDGIIARKLKSVTKHGELLDPAVDKIFTISALAVFVEKHFISSIVVFLIVAREMIITWLRSVMVNRGIVVPASIAGKIKTALQMAGIFLLAINQVFIGSILIWISIVVAYISAFEYLKLLKE